MSRLRVDIHEGSFEIALEETAAPKTCAYFRELAEHQVLDGGQIFRVTADVNRQDSDRAHIHVIQLGTSDQLSAPRTPITHESTAGTGLSHRQWTVSAARFEPGELYRSFFVCMRDEPELDFGGRRQADGQGYAAFGKVVSGFSPLLDIFALAGPDELLEKPVRVNCIAVIDAQAAGDPP